nr:proteoglycan 4-like [Procambarus clarkii]
MGLQPGNIIRPKPPRPPSETRRIRKPLMERKRRERINTSLNDLASLLAEAHLVKGEAGKPTKLEKADILELTVKHLLRLKSRASGTSKGTAAPPSKLLGVEDSQNGGSSIRVLFQGATVPQSVNILEGKNSPTGSVVQQECAIPQGSAVTQEDTATQRNIAEQEKAVSQGGSAAQNNTNVQGDTLQQGRIIVQTYAVAQGGNVAQKGTSSPETPTTVKTFQASQDDRPNLKAPHGKTPAARSTHSEENYRLGFKKCISTIDSAMKQYLEHEHDNIRPRLLQHLHSFLKLVDNKNSSTHVSREAPSTSPSGVPSSTQEEQPFAHPTVSTSKATSSSQCTTSTSPQVPGLTLVPTRLPSGSLAFVIQGVLDPSLLFETAEDSLGNNSKTLATVNIRNVKAETCPSSIPATITMSSGITTIRTASSATKIEPGNVKSEGSKCEIKNDISKQTSTLEEFAPTEVYAKPISNLEVISLAPRAPGASSSAVGTTPGAVGTTPSVTGTPSAAGTTPSVAGTTPRAAGTTPSATGTTPSVAGTTPRAAGTTPSAAGTTPSAAGTTPRAAGTTLSAAGTTPRAAGTTPSAAGTTLSAAGTTPSAAGTVSVAGSAPSPAAPVGVMVFSNPPERLLGFQNLHRLPPTPPTPPTGSILSRISPTLFTPTTSKGHGTIRFTHRRVASNSGGQSVPPMSSPTKDELQRTAAAPPTSQAIINEGFQTSAIAVQPKTSTQYLPATPSGTSMRSVQILTPENTPPGSTFHRVPQQPCMLTPTTIQGVYMLPPTPPTPPTLHVLRLETPTPGVLPQEGPLKQPPPMPVFIQPQRGGDQVLEKAEAMEEGEEVEMDMLMDVGEDIVERRQHNNMPFDLSLRRMWRPW